MDTHKANLVQKKNGIVKGASDVWNIRPLLLLQHSHCQVLFSVLPLTHSIIPLSLYLDSFFYGSSIHEYEIVCFYNLWLLKLLRTWSQTIITTVRHVRLLTIHTPFGMGMICTKCVYNKVLTWVKLRITWLRILCLTNCAVWDSLVTMHLKLQPRNLVH